MHNTAWCTCRVVFLPFSLQSPLSWLLQLPNIQGKPDTKNIHWDKGKGIERKMWIGMTGWKTPTGYPYFTDLGVRIYDGEYKGVDVHKRFPNTIRLKLVTTKRLRSAGDNDRRSKRFCSIAVICVSFTWQIVKTRVIRLRMIKGPNARDQIGFCTFHSFLVEVQSNAGYIHRTHA